MAQFLWQCLDWGRSRRCDLGRNRWVFDGIFALSLHPFLKIPIRETFCWTSIAASEEGYNQHIAFLQGKRQLFSFVIGNQKYEHLGFVEFNVSGCRINSVLC